LVSINVGSGSAVGSLMGSYWGIFTMQEA
jgi:hypothetical protein